MDQSKWKRALALVIAVLLIAAFGCGKAALDGKVTAEVSPAVVALDAGASSETDSASAEYSGSAEHTGIYNVDETADESASGSYSSSTPNENTVLVQNAGQLKISSADINKTGDAEGAFWGGINAAVAVVSRGEMTLFESNVTTNALGGFGLYASDTGSVLTLAGTYVYTSGDSSPALAVNDGGSVTITGGILSTEGMDSPCLLLSGGNVTLNGVTLSAANDELLRVLSGANELSLDNTALAATPILGEGATLLLKLINGASFTGELGGELPAKVSLSLDAASTLAITADTYLTALMNADTTHQNIQSNGFNLYYDSNAPENAYLNNQSFALPGGGYLAPII